MERAEIRNKLREFVKAEFKIPDNDPDFSDDVNLFDFGYVDSFGAVTLTSYVETAFGVKISDSDLVAYPLNTIVEIADFVDRRTKREV